MKKILLLAISLLLISSAAAADHIGIYSDANGTSCILTSGLNSSATIMHRYSTNGATLARFKLSPPAGTVLLGFSSPFVQAGDLATGLTVFYGECKEWEWVVGQVLADWAPGFVFVTPADTYLWVTYTDCSYAEMVAGGGVALVDGTHDPCSDAAESTTWGRVKSLYR